MTAAETDQQLVARVQKGDSRAFDMLVLKYQHKIFGLISRYVHDADEVQDVCLLYTSDAADDTQFV